MRARAQEAGNDVVAPLFGLVFTRRQFAHNLFHRSHSTVAATSPRGRQFLAHGGAARACSPPPATATPCARLVRAATRSRETDGRSARARSEAHKLARCAELLKLAPRAPFAAGLPQPPHLARQARGASCAALPDQHASRRRRCSSVLDYPADAAKTSTCTQVLVWDMDGFNNLESTTLRHEKPRALNLLRHGVVQPLDDIVVLAYREAPRAEYLSTAAG